MSYRTIWIYYCVATAVAIAMYVTGKVLSIDAASEMWTAVWGLVVCANIYAIKSREEENRH